MILCALMEDAIENPTGAFFFDSDVVDGSYPDHLSCTIGELFDMLDEHPGPWHGFEEDRGTSKGPSSDTLKGLDQGKLPPDLPYPDKAFQTQAESTAALEDFSRELGSAQRDKSVCLEAPDRKQETGSELLFKPEGSFNNLISSCHPLSVNDEISHAIQHADSASENYCYFTSNHSPNWLSLSTTECNTSLMDLDENSFASLMTGNFDHQQLQNNVSNCNALSGNAEGEGLLYSPFADFGNGFYTNDDQEKDVTQMRGKILFQTGAKESESDADNVNSLYMLQNGGTDSSHAMLMEKPSLSDGVHGNINTVAVPDSSVLEGSLCPSLSMYSSMGSDATLLDALLVKSHTSDTTGITGTGRGSCSTLYQEQATGDAKYDLSQFFPGQISQLFPSHEKETMGHIKDKREDQLLSSQNSCRTSELKLEPSVIELDASLQDTIFAEGNHFEDVSFRSESSTDSSPLPSGRNSIFDVGRSAVDTSKQLVLDSEINLHSKKQTAFPENGREDQMLASYNKQQDIPQESCNAIQKNHSRSSISVDDDAEICILDDISDPAYPPPPPVHIKPHPFSQRSGFSDPQLPWFRGMSLKADDERLTFRIALQPKSEASPPEGVLAVPLLRHQRIALSWMVQKETASLHCSGGILADDQGLGKTISTIALILMERFPLSRSCSTTYKQNEFEALNLDDDTDDDDDVSEHNFIKQPRNSSYVVISKPVKIENSMMVVKSRPSAGTLVVCPTSVLRQWAEELQNKVTSKANLSFLVYHGSNRTKDPNELTKYDVVLTTYAIVSMEVPKQPLVEKDEEENGKPDASGVPIGPITIKKRKSSSSNAKNMKDGITMDGSLLESAAKPLARVGWFRVILDEAQSIKNHRTQVARACWGLRAKRRWCLSGTPIQNAVDDLYSYFRFLRYDPYAVYKSFCSTIKMPISKNPANGYRKLQAVLKTIMLRRTKGTLIDGKPIITLPPKTVTLKKVDFSKDERAFYSALEAESQEQFKVYAAAGTVKQNYVNILFMLLRLRQACDHPLLVKGYDSDSVWRSSMEMAKKLPREEVENLSKCLETCLTICTICNDLPEDAVVTICGHVFCKQCICEHLTGDDNICPSAHCNVRLNVASVFSKGTLRSSLCDQHGDACCSSDSGPELVDTTKLCGNHSPSGSSKIKAALEILQSLPKSEYFSSNSNFNNSNHVAIGSVQNTDNTVPMSPIGINDDRKHSASIEGSLGQVTEKAIVFSQWTTMLDLLEIPLKDSCIQYRRLDGTMSVAAREKAVKDFNSIPEVTVMIMSLKAASLGLNMVAACHVLLLDLWWNPTTEDQAIDRAHRIGQTRPVTVSRLTVNDTVEDRILALQEKKREMVASAFGEDESGSRQTRLTVEDLNYLFNV
ncbi:helicase-like transcription factor CHR28 isoform X1 [Elaeis guineensis]|uniref:Helicase-like transcription factor CHR28 isoform X2 n=1 Tax=Elaeis guineensis var. tenera TaxID=51953 RepID=A0A8N4EQ27_ELAGV|nr:helicase-like transcription factor CHR28 isoform X2 [Elaeis guineensis]